MDGIGALIKEHPQSSLALSAMRGHSRKTGVREPGGELSLDTGSAGT